MQNLPVHWSEGMFLRPQHFQAADRYWTEVIQSSEQWDTPYHYGLRSIAISPEAIANSQVDVSQCDARFKDGTLASRQAGQGFPRIDLKPAFEREASVDVFLAVPKLKLGQPNVGMEGAAERTRYIDRTLSVQDESAGGNDQEIGHRELNLRLMLSTQDTAGYELLPIARVKRAEKEGTPQIDPNYFPPMIAVEAWPELSHGVIRVIYDIIGQKIEVIAQQVQSRGITLASQHPGDLERVLMLHVLNQASAHLKCLVFATGVHPFMAYSELCRIVGMLSIFGRARRISGELPQYDHDDLARIFRWIRGEIELLLAGVRDYEYERRDFVGAGTGMMQVRLEPKWVGSDWRWYVGVQGTNVTHREIQELLRPGRLDWKLASSGRVDQAFKLKIPALGLTIVSQSPPELPSGGDWLYHEVSRDNEVEWTPVTRDLTLAVRFNEQIITNASELQGKTKVQLKLPDKRAELGFALFAVPRLDSRGAS